MMSLKSLSKLVRTVLFLSFYDFQLMGLKLDSSLDAKELHSCSCMFPQEKWVFSGFIHIK
jgi:hypothetical protein